MALYLQLTLDLDLATWLADALERLGARMVRVQPTNPEPGGWVVRFTWAKRQHDLVVRDQVATWRSGEREFRTATAALVAAYGPDHVAGIVTRSLASGGEPAPRRCQRCGGPVREGPPGLGQCVPCEVPSLAEQVGERDG